MSSAKAAATAAFKGNKPASEKNANEKPSLRLPREAMAAKPVLHNTKSSGAVPLASPQAPTPRQLPLAATSESDHVESPTARADPVDYFSCRKNSAKDAARTGRSKAPTNTRPQDMLDSVRYSIMSKSKTNTSKESQAKNQLALNEFRQSVNSKRVSTSTPVGSPSQSSHSMLHLGERPRSSSSLILNSSANTSDPGYASHSNLSHSSFGSAFSENEALDNSVPNVTVTKHNDISDERLRMPNSRANAPIHVPPSPNARAREVAVINDTLPNLSLLQHTSSSDALMESNIPVTKPRRKPPPSQILEKPKECSSAPRESSESDRLKYSMSDTDDSPGISFPLFPELSMKHHGRMNIFKKKKKVDSKGVVYDPSTQNDDAETDLLPNNNSNPVNTQPVKLKTTMRKMSKRKERKTVFNEDKPWKHQKDLEVISELQKKRYEGLWVSNKGLYMDHVVNKLVGVDYSGSVTPKEESESRLSEKDIIERAAKLSSQAFTELDLPSIAALHGLKEATPSELIHGAVVKRLWSRSKLPPETLAAIWNLVDYRHDGTLNKSEFIVGMWCVDQCLFGRKLPKVVSKLVWASLGSLGVNVTIKKKRR